MAQRELYWVETLKDRLHGGGGGVTRKSRVHIYRLDVESDCGSSW